MKKTLLSLVLVLIVMAGANAQNEKIQSGIMYHFTKYVAWPAGKSSGNFVIGVVGNSTITPHLKALASAKKVGTRSIIVKEFSSVSAADGCNIIYLSAGKSAEFSSAVSKAKATNALLVTDKDGLGKKGAGINFTVKDGKQKFEINNSAIKGCKLKVDSKLAALGIVVG